MYFRIFFAVYVQGGNFKKVIVTATIVYRFGPFRGNRGCLLRDTGGILGRPIVTVVDNDFARHNRITIYSGFIHTGSTLRGNTSLILRLPIIFSLSKTRNFTGTNITVTSTFSYAGRLTFNDRDNSYRLLGGSTGTIYSREMRTFIHSKVGGNKCCPHRLRGTIGAIFNSRVSSMLYRPGGVLNVRCVGTLGNANIRPFSITEANITRSDQVTNRSFTSTSRVERVLHGNRGTGGCTPCVPSRVAFPRGLSEPLLCYLHAVAERSVTGLPSINRKLRGEVTSTTIHYDASSRVTSLMGAGHCARTHVQEVLTYTLLKVRGTRARVPVRCIHILNFAGRKTRLLGSYQLGVIASTDGNVEANNGAGTLLRGSVLTCSVSTLTCRVPGEDNLSFAAPVIGV